MFTFSLRSRWMKFIHVNIITYLLLYITYLCVNTSQFLYWFYCWWTYGLFPDLGHFSWRTHCFSVLWWMAIYIILHYYHILYYYLVNGHILYYILKNTIAKSQSIHMFRFGCKSQLSPKVGFPNLPFVSNIWVPISLHSKLPHLFISVSLHGEEAIGTTSL